MIAVNEVNCSLDDGYLMVDVEVAFLSLKEGEYYLAESQILVFSEQGLLFANKLETQEIDSDSNVHYVSGSGFCDEELAPTKITVRSRLFELKEERTFPLELADKPDGIEFYVPAPDDALSIGELCGIRTKLNDGDADVAVNFRVDASDGTAWLVQVVSDGGPNNVFAERFVSEYETVETNTYEVEGNPQLRIGFMKAGEFSEIEATV